MTGRPLHGTGYQPLRLYRRDHRLCLISSTYQSQIFRGAILSLPEGQLKAARALGLSDLKAIAVIVLPQALRLSVPGWSNEFF